MKFPAIVAALMLLECAVALPTPPPLKPSGGASGGKSVSEPHGRTGAVTNKNVQQTPTSTGELSRAVSPAAVSRPAVKAARANPIGLPTSSSVPTKQSTETSLSASGNTAKSAEKSSTPTAKSSSNPTEAVKAAGTTPQPSSLHQPLPKSANPTAQTTKQPTTQSSTPDKPQSKSVNPTTATTQTTKQTTTQSRTSDQPLSKSVNAANAATAQTTQTTNPSVKSQGGSGKPKRAVAKPIEFSRPPSTKVKAPLDRPVGHLTKSQSAGTAARTDPTNNPKKSLPRTNAAFRAASAASHREATPTEKSATTLPKTTEPSRKTAPHSQTTTKTAGTARDNRDSVGKVEENTRHARAVIKPQLSVKPKESRGAITKAPIKTTPRPVLPEKGHSHATEGHVEVSKNKRSKRTALSSSTQAPQVSTEISTTQGTVKPSGKATGELPTSVVGKSGKTDAVPESTVNHNTKAPTSISDVLSEMVKTLISTSEITKEAEQSAAGNSNYSGVPQSTDTAKTTPPTSTIQVPVRVTSPTTKKPSHQADSSTSEARIIPGLEFAPFTAKHGTTASPVVVSASTVNQPAVEKSLTKIVTSSPTTHSPVGKTTEIPSTTIKIH